MQRYIDGFNKGDHYRSSSCQTDDIEGLMPGKRCSATSYLLLSRTPAALATTGAPVLRGSALEIVDHRGRVRASIKVQPAETFRPTGGK